MLYSSWTRFFHPTPDLFALHKGFVSFKGTFCRSKRRQEKNLFGWVVMLGLFNRGVPYQQIDPNAEASTCSSPRPISFYVYILVVSVCLGEFLFGYDTGGNEEFFHCKCFLWPISNTNCSYFWRFAAFTGWVWADRVSEGVGRCRYDARCNLWWTFCWYCKFHFCLHCNYQLQGRLV